MIIIIADDFEDSLTKLIIDELFFRKIQFTQFSFEKNKSCKNKIACTPQEHEQLMREVINPILNNEESPLAKGYLFLFEFKQGINRSELEYKFAISVRFLNLKRLFYNRRSIEGCYFITDDFYGIDSGKGSNQFESKIRARFNSIAEYKLSNDFLSEKGQVKKNIISMTKNYLIAFTYFFFLMPKLFLISKNSKTKNILLVMPKQNNWYLAKSRSIFLNQINYVKLCLELKKDYNIIFCIHPQNQNSYFSTLLRLIGITYITSLYSKEARKIIEMSHLSISIGSSAVIDLLNFNLLSIEIGKSNRVCNFLTNYHFIDETGLTMIDICNKIREWSPSKENVYSLPYFSYVFFPKINDKSSVKDQIDEGEVSSLAEFIGSKYEHN